MEFFPLGTTHYILGGLLIGISFSFVYFLTAYILGASAMIDALLSFVSDRFKGKFRELRLVFMAGLIAGAGLYTLIWGSVFVTEVSMWRLFLGGILVGFGTRLGRGCTSGHGIAGTASLSLTSILNVLTFMTVAIIVANVIP